MFVNWNKETSSKKCAECGKTELESNLHEIEIGNWENKIKFCLCYECLKKLGYNIAPVRPEGVNPFEICSDNQYEPEDAADCLYCRECITSTINGIDKTFECLIEKFHFYPDEVPQRKRCEKKGL